MTRRTQLLIGIVSLLLLVACGKGLVDESYSVKFIGLQPAPGPMKGGTTVQLYGQNLHDQLALFLGKRKISGYKVLSDTTIEFTLPPSTKPGPVELRVDNLHTQQTWRKASGFRYKAETIKLHFGSELGLGTVYTVFGAADLTGDGQQEVITADPATETLSVYTRKQGLFQRLAKHPLPWGASFARRPSSALGNATASIVIGDFDGDRQKDAILAYSDSQRLLFFRGDKEKGLLPGRWVAEKGALSPYHTRKLYALDVDRDGTDELLIVNYVRLGPPDVHPGQLGSVLLYSQLTSKEVRVTAWKEHGCVHFHSLVRGAAVKGQHAQTWTLLCTNQKQELEAQSVSISLTGGVGGLPSLTLKARKVLVKAAVPKAIRYYIFDMDDDGTSEYARAFEVVSKGEKYVCLEPSAHPKREGPLFQAQSTTCQHIKWRVNISSLRSALEVHRAQASQNKRWAFVDIRGVTLVGYSYTSTRYSQGYKLFHTATPGSYHIGPDYSRGGGKDAKRPGHLLADINQDGYLDLLSVGQDARVFVAYGTAERMTLFPTKERVEVPRTSLHPPHLLHNKRVHRIVSADLNGDNHKDTILWLSPGSDNYGGTSRSLGVLWGGPSKSPPQWPTLDGKIASHRRESLDGDNVFVVAGAGKHKDILVTAIDSRKKEQYFLTFSFRNGSYQQSASHTLRLDVKIGAGFFVLRASRQPGERWVSVELVQFGDTTDASVHATYHLRADGQVFQKSKRSLVFAYPIARFGDIDGDGHTEFLTRDGRYCSAKALERCKEREGFVALCTKGACGLPWYTGFSDFRDGARFEPVSVGEERHLFVSAANRQQLHWLVFRKGKKIRESVVSVDLVRHYMVGDVLFCDVDGDQQPELLFLMQPFRGESVSMFTWLQGQDGIGHFKELGHLGLEMREIHSVHCRPQKTGSLNDLEVWFVPQGSALFSKALVLNRSN